MIASITGTVSKAALDHAIIVVGGVGLVVRTTPNTAAGLRIGEESTLATTMVIREDSWTLYGFHDEIERDLFEVAQSVTGVGPRLALAMLSVFPGTRLRTVISEGDLASLVKVPGVGKKSAERIVLELKDKMAVFAVDDTNIAPDGETTPASGAAWRGPVVEALTSLGWNTKQAEAGADAVLAEVGEEAPVSDALRAALRELGR